jgi:hypothetical protein
MIVQTVATTSYLPYVATLIDSIKAFDTSAQFSVLLTDIKPERVESLRNKFDYEIEIICCDDLDIDHVESMREYYSCLEYNAACKILAVDYQINKNGQTECLFLDADMFCLGNLAGVLEKVNSDVAITPHSFAPYPNDGYLPSDIEIIQSGQINAGFLFVKKSPRACEAIAWMKEKTRFEWFIAPRYGMHAEQQWLSALPYFFNDVTEVLNDPAINIAYWNLHERTLSQDKDNIIVNGKPAILMHFSGYRMQKGNQFTVHSERVFDDKTEEALKKVVGDYTESIKRSNDMFGGIEGDLMFCDKPLYDRISIAQSIRNQEYFELYASEYKQDTQAGFFEKIGRKIDRLVSK